MSNTVIKHLFINNDKNGGMVTFHSHNPCRDENLSWKYNKERNEITFKRAKSGVNLFNRTYEVLLMKRLGYAIR